MATSLGNLYPNLPGMLIEFNDGGSALRFEDTDVSTDSLLLLGTAIDGPIMEPVAVDYETAELLFGSDTDSNGVPNGTTLAHAFKQAYETGCRDIRLMRISGSAAQATIETAGKSLKNEKRIDEEEIAFVLGNDKTDIKLPIEAGTVYADDEDEFLKVYAKGKKLDKVLYTLDKVKQELTIKDNACDASASIEVKYREVTKTAFKETLTIEALTVTKNGVILGKEADEIISVTKSGDATVKLTSKLQSNKTSLVITDSSVNIGDTVDVEYEIHTHRDLTAKTIAKASKQLVTLKNEPIENTQPVLYIDDAKVLDPSYYSVDGAKIYVHKENFKMNQTISVSYFIQTAEENVKSSIKIESYFGGDVYNEGTVEVKDLTNSDKTVIGKKVIITKPESKQTSSEAPQVYTSIDYPTLGLLADAITAKNGTYKAFTEDDNVLTSELVISSAYFSDGDNGLGLDADELFEALSGTRDEDGYIITQGAYQILENYQVDEVVPVGVYADDELKDKYSSFAYELALFCAISSYRNKTTIGAISMKPIKDTTLSNIQKHAKYLTNFKNTYYMLDNAGVPVTDSNGNKFDIGKYISVVAGPSVTFNHSANALKEGNAAVMYMGYISTLGAQSAPTNKKVYGTTGLKYNFSNSQLNDIVGNRMVTFQLKYSSTGKAIVGAYVVDAPTAALKNSDYTRLSTVRVIRDVADSIREVADPFIGEPNTIEQRNALSAAIAKRLDLLVENGVIVSYTYNLVATAIQQVLGEASLELGIVPPQELRKITTVIGLTSSQS